MSFVLMVVGILATALGAALIGFGIPINEFSLGNTLILAGTVTAVGGLIIFAVSRAISQLVRIADTLGSRPVTAVSGATSDAYESPPPELGRAVPRGPSATRAGQDGSSNTRAPEPRLQPDNFDLPSTVEPVRRSPMAGSRGGQGLDDTIDSPLSPRTAGRTAAAESTQQPSWRPPRPLSDPRQRKPVSSPAPGRREPALDAVPGSSTEPSRPEPVSVLKSGVVDGMAYTLYTDGSIEAELAQGVVRFGSIEELRNHLEKSA